VSKEKASPESTVRDIKRKTRRKFTAEEKIRIVLVGLRGEESTTDLCRREGIHPAQYCKWSKAFLEAGKRQLTGDTVREAGSEEVKELRAENEELKQAVAI
jgi:transposase